MRLCVGALKEFLDRVGGALQRPTDHAGASGNGDAPPPPSKATWSGTELVCAAVQQGKTMW